MSGIGGHMNRKLSRHRCDNLCVCPVHETPLLFALYSGEHVCQDRDCVHAHGIVYTPAMDARYPDVWPRIYKETTYGTPTYEHRYIPVVEYDEDGREVWTPPLPAWTLTEGAPT